MPQTPGDTFNLCEVNPADVVGSVDNILTRLTNLEIIVARLLGWDLSVLQLSDLSQDAGMLQNVTQIFVNNTGLIQGMTYDYSLPMPQDGRTYTAVFNTELVDGILVYRVVAWIPSSGNGAPGAMLHAVKAYNSSAAEAFSNVNGITLARTDEDWANQHVEYSFTAPSAGLYMIGGSVTHGNAIAGDDWAYVAIYDGFQFGYNGYPGNMSGLATGAPQSTCTVCNYLSALQTVRVFMSWSGNGTQPPYAHSVWVTKLT